MSVLVSVGTALSFYFSEIIIRSDVNLITSNQLSDTGEVGEVQPALVGSLPPNRVLGGKLNILNAQYFDFLHSTSFQLFS